IARHAPAAAERLAAGAGATAGAALHPAQMAGLTAAELLGIRAGIAEALPAVFLPAIPALGGAPVATWFIPEPPLRRTPRRGAAGGAGEAGREVLAGLTQAAAAPEPARGESVDRPEGEPRPA